MKRRTILKQLTLAALAVPVKANRLFLPGEPMATGAFKPTWESLAQYRVPEWYRDAKFGIWAHWGAQCEPEHGDWYARGMYEEGSDAYRFHLENYGHPSKVGFKDIIHRWKADAWNPDELVGLYKKAGAKYFVGMANHHDNLDNYNSKYHTWNSVRLGPKKDLIGGWAKAAKKHGLHFGVSIHAAHAWSWYETAQGADKNGPLAGVPYDGKLTAADGKGTWWEGLDPQQLYAQNHALSRRGKDVDVNSQWAWGGGSSVPSAAYCEQFYNRTLDLINQYDP
ncbi:MAG: alpha-L-fucosidase, partial [Siphonobacter aquaeclarae]|nr:alpha-L-fucosidase [Siphonobacter aquaeclarae]